MSDSIAFNADTVFGIQRTLAAENDNAKLPSPPTATPAHRLLPGVFCGTSRAAEADMLGRRRGFHE